MPKFTSENRNEDIEINRKFHRAENNESLAASKSQPISSEAINASKEIVDSQEKITLTDRLFVLPNNYIKDKPNGFTKKSQDGSNITIAETVGGRVDRTLGIQQDAAWVSYIPKDSPIFENPEEFYNQVVTKA